MENKEKRVSIVKKVLSSMIIVMLVINIIAIIVIGMYVEKSLLSSEEKYLGEIVDNISSTIESTMYEYVYATKMMSQNQSFIALLNESDLSIKIVEPEITEFDENNEFDNELDLFNTLNEDISNDGTISNNTLDNVVEYNRMENHENVDKVVLELNNIKNQFDGGILNVALMSIAQDGYLLHDGSVSGSNFSFKGRPYYSVVSSRNYVLTEPYVDDSTGNMVVSICNPIMNDLNEVIGAVLIDLDINFISNLLVASRYGSTGDSIIVDINDNILAASDSSLLQKSYTQVGLTGNALTTQIANPTASIISFDYLGEPQTGAVDTIGSFGWKVITAIDTAELKEDVMSVRLLLTLIQAATIVISLVVCALIIKKQLEPIGVLNKAMGAIVKGDMHYVVTHHSNDEIGELADNLRATINNLADYIDEIGRLLKEFGGGNFTVERSMNFLGDFESIQVNMDEFIELISTTLSSLKGTVKQVSLGSSHVSEGSQNLASGSIEQSSNIHNLNEFVADITVKINDNATNANEINVSAKTIQNELSNSNAKMVEMVKSMLDINEKSEQIKTIVANIEDIAFQTNILALNAAVEASRAGQHGKGFAIVADEVRNLASKISVDVQTAQDLVEASVASVGQGCDLADETAKNLDIVTNDVNLFTVKLEEISHASQEQAKAIKEINLEIEAISGIMQTNTAISEESAATAQQLSAQASVMNEAIDQFKTK